MSKTERIEIRIEPDFRARIDAARGLVPLSAWVSDLIGKELARLASNGSQPSRPVVFQQETPPAGWTLVTNESNLAPKAKE